MASTANILSASRLPEARESTRRDRVTRTTMALLAPFVSFGVELVLWPWVQPNIWYLFYPVLFVSAWLGGLRLGLLSTAISIALIVVFFIPEQPPVAREFGHLFPAIVFASMGILVSAFLDRVQRRNEQLRRLVAERQIFAALVDNSSDFIGIADPDGKPVYVNPAGRRMVGLAPDHPIATTTITEYYAPEQRQFAAEVILKSMVEHGHWHGETYFRNWQTGAAIAVSDTHFMVRDPDSGEVLGMATITRDISEQRRLERQLHEVSTDLGRAQEVAEIGSWRVTAGRDEVRWSAQTYTMFGVPPGAPTTYETFLDHVHPEDRAYVHASWQAALRGKPYDIEHRIIVGGITRWVRSKAELERDEQGNFAGGIGIVQNITKLKRVEIEQVFLAEAGAVLASTLDYEQTLNNIARLAVRELAAYCVVDILDETGAVRRLKVACHDPADAWICETLTRVSIDAKRPYFGRAVLDSRQGRLLERVTPQMIAAFAESEEHRRALEHMTAAGAIQVPLIARDTVLGVISLTTKKGWRPFDENDLHVAEELGRRAAISIDNARLYATTRRAVQSRDDVLAIVAHDLRNPLSAIMLHTATLRDHAEARQERAIGAIERSSKRMNRLIQDLLDIARIESGRLPLSHDRIPAGVVLATCIDSQQPLAASAGIELAVESDRDLPELWADPDRVVQIFENLVGNALKFTKPGGHVTIRARDHGSEVLFEVADTGAGIPLEHQPHVFDRFWQARVARRHGAGLGLPIVKGLVEAHGGRIWFDSTPGRGTTFHFTIPVSVPRERWDSQPAQHGA